MKHDLSQLYSRLGLSPGCTLDEFKHAYRRRIAELHPDHARDTSHDAGDLRELVWLYATASRFHRRHGRLPGASAVDLIPRLAHPAQRTEAMIPPVASPLPDTGKDMLAIATTRGERPLRAASLALPAAAVLLLMLLSGDWLTPAAAPGSSETSALAADPSPRWLERGMPEATVLAIQGEPSERKGDRWIYGPSWVRFGDGRVIDWYSARQRPLKTAGGGLPTGDARAGTDRR